MTSAIVLHCGADDETEKALLDAFRSSVEQRSAPLRQAVSCVARLLDLLVDQVMSEHRNAVARGMIEAAGFEPPPRRSAADEILSNIRLAVDELAEVARPGQVHEPKASAAENDLGPSLAIDPALEREVDQLDTCWRSLHSESLTDAELRLNLQLLAVRARRLQERVPDGCPSGVRLATIIRGITHLQRERKPGFVIGLRRTDVRDWAVLETKAIAELDRFRRDAEEGVPQRPTPHVREREANPPQKLQQDPALEPLRARIHGCGPLVIVGGQPDPQKLLLVRGLLGDTPEWVETTDGKTRPIQALCERVSGGRVAGIILLFGLMSHSADGQVGDACKQSATPFFRIERPGSAQLERALVALAGMCTSTR